MGKREEKRVEQAFARLERMVQIKRDSVAIVARGVVRGDQDFRRLKEAVDELDTAEAALREAQRLGTVQADPP